MRISIFGLGYVGCVCSGCLAKMGHSIIGVDINSDKVNLINKGIPTIVEKDIDFLIKENQTNGKLRATTDYADAVLNTSISIICVGTPSLVTGQLNLDYVFETAKLIGENMKDKNEYHTIAIRSTVFPGTNEKVSKIIEDASGKKANVDFGVVSNPEFLREGSAVKDYFNPSITVLGSESDVSLNIMEELYSEINAPIIKTKTKTAEIIKYVNNTFHALKISFANEIGNICKSLDIDSFDVMNLFMKDTNLNISPVYFKPGMAYGGSCLPKDLKGLNTIAYDLYLQTPLISSINRSNEFQKDRAFEMIVNAGSNKVGILGLAFKKGTDDLRYSPTVDIVERLIGKGFEVIIYDKFVNLSRLIGANKSYIESKLPHISSVLTDDINILIKNSDTVVFSQKYDEINNISDLISEKNIIDFVGIDFLMNFKKYQGLCW